MTRIIHFSIALIVAVILLVVFLMSDFFPILKPEVKLILPSIYITICFFVFIGWAGDIMGGIKKSVEEQLADFHAVENCRKDKEHFRRALKDYKEEFEEKLLSNYRTFEETIMANIKDSKLIAAALQESSYAKVLQNYHTAVKATMVDIRRCDTGIESYIKQMKIREGQKLFGNGLFLPSEFKHDKLKTD